MSHYAMGLHGLLQGQIYLLQNDLIRRADGTRQFWEFSFFGQSPN
jgi:hypothetical protein